jgi:hypothetical protein
MKKNITAYSGKDQEEDVVYRSLNNVITVLPLSLLLRGASSV